MRKPISLEDVMAAFQRAAQDYGMAHMAAALNIAISTMSNKVNPYDSEERRHYLNVFEAIRIMDLTGDTRPLALLAEKYGFMLRTRDARPDAPTMFEEFFQDNTKATAFQVAGVKYREGRITLRDLIHARDAYIQDITESYQRIVDGDEEDV